MAVGQGLVGLRSEAGRRREDSHSRHALEDICTHRGEMHQLTRSVDLSNQEKTAILAFLT